MTDQLAPCPTCGAPAIEARLAIREGMCPLCPRGPFRVPLSHIARVHNIGRREARRLFGIASTEPACDPAHSARARAVALAWGFGSDRRKNRA